MTEGEVDPVSWRAYAGVGVAWFLALRALAWMGLASAKARAWVSAGAFLALGGMCWANGKECGAIHCRISGPGYVAIGLVAVLSALGLVDVSSQLLVVAFVAIALGSYVIEAAIEASSQGSTA